MDGQAMLKSVQTISVVGDEEAIEGPAVCVCVCVCVRV